MCVDEGGRRAGAGPGPAGCEGGAGPGPRWGLFGAVKGNNGPRLEV